MLWLGLYFPELPLEVFLRGTTDRSPAAVHAVREGRETVLRCNAAARAGGVHPGLPVPAALALLPRLRLWPRDAERERRAMETLALWAWQFSSRLYREPALLLFEIGASLRLFGGMEALLGRIEAELPALGHEVRLAVAHTATAAALLARERPGARVASREALLPWLEDIPMARLSADPRVRQLVRDIGLHGIGDVLRLPRPELARRLGPGLPALLDRLLGDAPDPRPAWRPPPHFLEWLELPAELDDREALRFPARRLLLTLCGWLRGQGAATQHLRWHLRHPDDLPETAFAQTLLRPERDAEYLLARFGERLQRLELPAPVRALGLEVRDCLPFSERTAALLDAPAGGDAAGEWLERLHSRLGPRLTGLCPVADHRPERAQRCCAPGETGARPSWRGELPLWLLPQPRPLRVRAGRPWHRGALELLGPPRRIETGWWDGDDVARDYYLARNPANERFWIYRDRRGGGWFLHGLFD